MVGGALYLTISHLERSVLLELCSVNLHHHAAGEAMRRYEQQLLGFGVLCCDGR